MKDNYKDNSITSVYGLNKTTNNNGKKKLIYGLLAFFGLLFIILTIAILISAKNARDEENLFGYTMESQQFVDSCKLVNVDGAYLGTGILKNQVHYIFQGEKNGKLSDNKDVTDKEIELHYLSVNDTSNPKFATVDAYARKYIKKNTSGVIKKQTLRYFYKIYIPNGAIKNLGELSADSEDAN